MEEKRLKCAIMQPTYIPWIGYFHMIKEVDYFVFLNDVQFSKRSWQQRNQIYNNNGKTKWLTIPVETKGKRTQLINETKILSGDDWLNRHKNLIKNIYKNHPHYDEVTKIYEDIDINEKYLENINIQIIKKIANKFEFETKFIKSSHLGLDGSKSNYLLNICKELGSTTYISASGSREYIEKEGYFSKSDVAVQYHSGKAYTYNDYKNEKKHSYLSIVDYIANCGYEKGVFKDNENNLFD